MAKSRYRDLWTRARAAYVLDGLLYHESEIDPEEHYTDTHGYTELNFASFAMFGKRFCPRIRGLHRQWIYRIDPDKGSAHIRVEIQHKDPFLSGPGTIEDVLAVENDVVPFDRADVLGAGLRPGLPW